MRIVSLIVALSMLLENGIPVYAGESDNLDETAVITAKAGNMVSPNEPGYVPGEVLVVYEKDISDSQVEQIAEEMDSEVVETIEDDANTVAVISISDDMTVDEAIEEFTQNPDVAYAEPNYIMESFGSTEQVQYAEDPYVSQQWYLDYVHAREAWDILQNYDGDQVHVGVIDTGVNLEHEDLSEVINTELSVEVVHSTNGDTYTTKPLRGDGYLNGTDEQNSNTVHGTHVAGILAAQSGNGVGIQGVASGGSTGKQNEIVDIVAIDAFTLKNSNGEDGASVADLIYALKYAKEQDCKVVNLSLGTSKESTVLRDTCEGLKEAGITIVCAAGNSNSPEPIYPADYDSTISVINVNSDGQKNSTSNYGVTKDLSAPGTNIYSTISTGNSAYSYKSGTSMAAPIVSAAAAMLLYTDSSLTPDQIKSILCETATDLMSSGKDIYTGYGSVNIEEAMRKAGKLGEPDYTDPEKVPVDTTNVTYRCHAQTYGWLDWTKNGSISGTTGQSKRLEAIQIELKDQGYSGSIEYRTYLQTYGWQAWKADGAVSGTTGQSRRMEAIQIQLTGELAKHYDVYYRVHSQTYGWLGWTCNGATAGTSDYAKRLEAIQIRLIPKGNEAPGSTENPYLHPFVQYQTHVQTYGWQSKVYDGTMSGTTGQSKRLEAIKISLPSQEFKGDILYRTHVQTYGWQDFVANGKLSGTTGQSKRMEAIEIKLNGEMSQHYDIYYRVHVQSYGWLGWAKNGEPAGTVGQSKRMEAIEIVLVEKGQKAPGSLKGAFYE